MDVSATKRKRHYWFHKPNEEHPEIPDITIPRDLYVIKTRDLEFFLKYKGEEVIDFNNRFHGYRLVKFRCPVKTLMVHISENRNTIHFCNIILLLDKLLIHKVEVLCFKELLVD